MERLKYLAKDAFAKHLLIQRRENVRNMGIDYHVTLYSDDMVIPHGIKKDTCEMTASFIVSNDQEALVYNTLVEDSVQNSIRNILREAITKGSKYNKMRTSFWLRLKFLLWKK